MVGVNESSPVSSRVNVPRVVRTVALLVAAPVTLCSIAGLFGSLGWLLDLTSHFRIQYTALLLACTIALATIRSWRLLGAAAFALLLNVVVIAPLYFGGSATREPATPGWSFVLFNVRTGNPEKERVVEYLRSAQSDVIAVLEVDRIWMKALNALEGYKVVVAKPRPDNFGMALLSRRPALHAQVLYFGYAGVPTIDAVFEHKSEAVRVILTHPVPPGSARGTFLRNSQLDELAVHVAAVSEPVILLGDLNATPWSSAFRQLVESTKLVSSQRGFGIQPTYPAGFPHLLIPIDHCLHSSSWVTRTRSVGPDLGSDHYPLLVSLAPSDTPSAKSSK